MTGIGRRRWSGGGAVLMMALVIPAGADHDPTEDIERLGRLLARTPTAARYAERANFLRMAGRCGAALDDLDRAMELDPGGALARSPLLARICLEAGAPECAALVALSGTAAALVNAGPACERMGRLDLAAAAYSAQIAVSPRPTPDLYLVRARAQARAFPEAWRGIVTGLDAGCAALGAPIGLELEALRLEVGGGDTAGALARIDAALARSAHTERWLARRGDVLVRGGRFTDAAAAYRAAAAALAERRRPLRGPTAQLRALVARAAERCDGWARTCPDPGRLELVLLEVPPSP